MNEMYWITRLDGVRALFIAVLIAAVAYMLVVLANYHGEKVLTAMARKLKYALCVVAVSAACLILIPTTQEALLIYGVGGTIDYIKSNDKAKTLPDKCVEALNRYLDTVNAEEK